MMNKFRQWLLQPYPHESNWQHHFKMGCYAGLFVALFLYFFRPFGLNPSGLSEGWLMRQCAYFGAATMLAVWLFGGMTYLLPRFFNEKDWVIWRELTMNASIIILITFANLWLGHLLYGNPLNSNSLYFAFRNTLLIGVFPILFSAYTNHLRWSKRYANEAQEATALLSNYSHQSTKPSTIQLKGDNQGEELQLNAQELLLIASADNYAKVIYWRDQKMQQQLIRATLKSLEEQLDAYQHFFRCHRTYLVNLRQVQQISGNAQGYKLHLINYPELVPVSRKLNQEIHARLPNL